MAGGVAGAQAAKALLERDVALRKKTSSPWDPEKQPVGKIELMRDGIDGATVQAERLGCTVPDIYRANERIAYHAALVKRAATRREADAHEARP